MSDAIIDPVDGQRFALVRHGLDRRDAMEAAAGSRVVISRFPQSHEAEAGSPEITAALKEISTSGAHFSNFASLFELGLSTVLLIEYIS